jgi:hypothetical protein
MSCHTSGLGGDSSGAPHELFVSAIACIGQGVDRLIAAEETVGGEREGTAEPLWREGSLGFHSLARGPHCPSGTRLEPVWSPCFLRQPSHQQSGKSTAVSSATKPACGGADRSKTLIKSIQQPPAAVDEARGAREAKRAMLRTTRSGSSAHQGSKSPLSPLVS